MEKELTNTLPENAGEEENNIEAEDMQPTATLDIDREEIIDAFLSDDEGKLYALLTPYGFSEEEIKEAKLQFVEAARKSLYRKDLQEILSVYRLNVHDIRDIPNFAKYATLRASGFSAIDAFEGANPRLARESEKPSYEHMKPITARQGTSGDIPIPKEELKLWQSAFPKATTEELTKRYNKARRS